MFTQLWTMLGGARRGRAGVVAVAMALATVGPMARSAAAAATFTAGPDVAVGTSPRSVAVGDFNGDGKADLAVANAYSKTVSIRLGVGNGTFTNAADVGVGTFPTSVAVGDFNGDGKADLAVAGENSGTVSVRLGVGDGTFTTVRDIAGLPHPTSVAVDDFNNDAKPDLAVANANPAGTVSIRLGAGDGTFTTAPDLAVGAYPRSVAVGDFNNDAKADLAVANSNSNTVSVRLGVGDGTFTTAADVGVGPAPLSVAVGDFNGDGKADLATANNNSATPHRDPDTASVRLGLGDGTFTTAPDVTVGFAPVSVTVADFNGDTKADLAVANADSTVSIRLGVGDGTFTTAADMPVANNAAADVAVGDFNNDDHADLAVASPGDLDVVAIFMNQDATPAAPPSCHIRAILPGPPKQLVVGASDLRSGIKSIAVTVQTNDSVRVEPFVPLGRFSPEVEVVATKINPNSLARLAFVVTDGAGRQQTCS